MVMGMGPRGAAKVQLILTPYRALPTDRRASYARRDEYAALKAQLAMPLPRELTGEAPMLRFLRTRSVDELTIGAPPRCEHEETG